MEKFVYAPNDFFLGKIHVDTSLCSILLSCLWDKGVFNLKFGGWNYFTDKKH